MHLFVSSRCEHGHIRSKKQEEKRHLVPMARLLTLQSCSDAVIRSKSNRASNDDAVQLPAVTPMLERAL